MGIEKRFVPNLLLLLSDFVDLNRLFDLVFAVCLLDCRGSEYPLLCMDLVECVTPSI